MSEAIEQFFATTFTNPYIATFLIAILPIVELRGAIPFGYLFFTNFHNVSVNPFGIWAAGFFGSAIVAPIIMLALIPFLNWLKRTKVFGKPAKWIDKKFAQKAEKVKANAIKKAKEKNPDLEYMSNDQKLEIEQKIDKRIEWSKLLGIFTFVAIPLPFTGVWTGSAVAAFLNVKFHKGLFAVLLGNLVASIIIAVLTVTLGFAF